MSCASLLTVFLTLFLFLAIRSLFLSMVIFNKWDKLFKKWDLEECIVIKIINVNVVLYVYISRPQKPVESLRKWRRKQVKRFWCFYCQFRTDVDLQDFHYFSDFTRISFFENLLFWKPLTLSWRRSLPYKYQFIDLACKSMDWFLYDKDLRHERVKPQLIKNFNDIRQSKNSNVYLNLVQFIIVVPRRLKILGNWKLNFWFCYYGFSYTQSIFWSLQEHF